MAKNISIKVKAEDQASSPIDKVSGKINTLSKNIKQSTSPLTNLGNSLGSLKNCVPGIGLIVGAVAGVTKAVKESVKQMKEWEQAWGNTEQTVIRLDFAAKINTQLKGTSKELQKFSSELSDRLRDTFSGGELNDAMASLAFNKTASQIKSIVSAATDLSVAMGIDLNTAISQLNGTFSGSAGQLGKLFPELNKLSKEALASGEAVNIVAEKVKGMADAMTDSINGSLLRSKNLKADLREELGYWVTDFFNPIRTQINDIRQKWRDALAIKRTFKEASERVKNGTADSTDYGVLLEDAVVRKERAKSEGITDLSGVNREIQKYTNMITELTIREQKAAEARLAAEEAARKAAEKSVTTTATKEKTKKATVSFQEYMAQMNQAIRTQNRLRDEESQKVLESIRLKEKEKQAQLEAERTANRQNITGAMGNAGQFIETAITGNWMSLLTQFIGSFVAKMSEQSEIINGIFNVVDTVLDKIVSPFINAVEPILAPIFNNIQAIGTIIGAMIKTVTPFIQIVQPIIELLGRTTAWIAEFINAISDYVMYGFTEVYNWFVKIYNAIVRKNREIAEKKQSKSLDEINTAMKKLFNGEFIREYTESLAATLGNAATGSTITGGSASYNTGRDIYVTINFNNSLVYSDRTTLAAELAREIRNAEKMNLI